MCATIEQPPIQQANKRQWFPLSKDGKAALWFCLLAIIWGVSMPFIPQAAQGGVSGTISGFITVSIALTLTIIGLIYSIRAIFRSKEKAVVTKLLFVVFCIVTGFWVLFALGEVLVSH
jgi:hypothetical protein